MQVGASGRRLHQPPGQGTSAQYLALVKATGAEESTTALANTVQQDPCEISQAGVSLCDVLVGARVASAPVIRDVFETVDFSAALVSYMPGKLQIRTRYLADGNLTTIMVPRVANGSAGSTNYLPCAASVDQGMYLLTCATTVGPEETLMITVAADSLATGGGLTVSMELQGSGGWLCCACVNSSQNRNIMMLINHCLSGFATTLIAF